MPEGALRLSKRFLEIQAVVWRKQKCPKGHCDFFSFRRCLPLRVQDGENKNARRGIATCSMKQPLSTPALWRKQKCPKGHCDLVGGQDDASNFTQMEKTKMPSRALRRVPRMAVLLVLLHHGENKNALAGIATSVL